MRKTHIKLKGKPLCGTRHAKRFVTGDTFDEIPEAEKCGRCKRAIKR